MPDFVIILSENVDRPGWTWEVSHYRDYLDVRATGVEPNEQAALATAMPKYRELDERPNSQI